MKGLEMAMGCESSIASEDLIFKLITIQLGIIPMLDGSVLLSKLISKERTIEILLTGEAFSTQILHRWGAMNKFVSKDNLLKASFTLIKRKEANGPKSTQGIV